MDDLTREQLDGIHAEQMAKDGSVTIGYRDENIVQGRVRSRSNPDQVWLVRIDPAGSECACPRNQKGRKTCAHIRAVLIFERFGVLYEAQRRARERMARRDGGR